jgi:hypothetical protein
MIGARNKCKWKHYTFFYDCTNSRFNHNIIKYCCVNNNVLINPSIPDLMDYPDSEDDGAAVADDATMEGAAMLDDDDAEQSEITTAAAMDQDSGEQSTSERDRGTATTVKGQSSGSSFTSYGGHTSDGPDLPPIYRTVRKEKEKQMVTRHLYGGASAEAACTDNGVAVSKVETIGSFANTGDKRHNHTMHRYDFNNVRNLSTSFNTSTLTCTTCQGEHTVLRREIEGADVGMDTPLFLSLRTRISLQWPLRGGKGTVNVSR